VIAHLARFCRALRAGDVPVVPSDTMDAAAALVLVDVGDRSEVRRTLQVSLKIRPRDRERFDRLFDLWWSATPLEEPARPRRARHARPGVPARVSELVRATAGEPGDAPDRAEGDTPGYSSHQLLLRKSFDRWSETDLAELEDVLARLALRLATRRSRRLVPIRGTGIVDLRRSFRRAIGTGGELVSLARRARPIERPRLVLLCDTSGSMDPHTRFLLAFVLSLRRVVRSLEVFAFNTELTRLTPWLSRRPVAEVLAQVAAAVPDWSGGTRIGECLEEFVRDHLATAVNGRTVVIVLSDGLDRGEPERLARAMAAIRSAARRVVWLNPLMGDPRYEPTARGMRAALPYVDRLAPAHNLESLERVVGELTA
jgi:uncharacterized protein with von Willebrand factor type A (vWA) domain